MKRNLIFVISLAFFSLIDGYLLSAISLIGRAGISLFYKQYEFLKIWWKGALLAFTVWIALFILQSVLFKKIKSLNIISTVLLSIAIAGLSFSYFDFRNTLSHRWLGERFHLGVYLFWLGWIAIVIYFRRKELLQLRLLKMNFNFFLLQLCCMSLNLSVKSNRYLPNVLNKNTGKIKSIFHKKT